MAKDSEKIQANAIVSSSPPMVPSKHVYLNIALGISLPLLIAFVVWRRAQPNDLDWSKYLYGVAWTYPLMIVGCIIGEILSRRLNQNFYMNLGDNPAQVVNLFTGWLFAHLYLPLLAVLLFALKKLA